MMMEHHVSNAKLKTTWDACFQIHKLNVGNNLQVMVAHLNCETCLSYMRPYCSRTKETNPTSAITAKATEHVLKNNHNNYDSNIHHDSPEFINSVACIVNCSIYYS